MFIHFSRQSVTLVELLVALALIGLLVVGISSLNTYANFHLLTSYRRARVQNEASYVLEHMAKHISQGIGNLDSPAVEKHTTEEWIRVRMDKDSDGQPDDDNPGDWIAYRWIQADHEIQYHAIADPPGSAWPTTGGEVLSQRITICNFSPAENYVSTDITACWDPDGSCGDIKNPEVTMISRIKLPAVSVN